MINAISYNHGPVGGYVGGEDPRSSTGWGRLENNILVEDTEELVRIAGLDLKVEVMINGFNESKRIFCGDMVADALILNVFSKSNETCLALAAWSRYVKPEAIVILIADNSRWQITHYAYGKFGKNREGAIFNPPGRLNQIGRLVVYSRYPEVDPQLPIALEKVDVSRIGVR